MKDFSKPGVYSDVPEEVYFDIEAINNSGLQIISEKTPFHFWFQSWMNPKRPPRKPPTPAKKLGTAIHAAILEPSKFEETYRVKPDPDDFPGVLVTVDDYKTACKALSIPVSGTKSELKARIRSVSTDYRFFDDIEAKASHYNLLTKEEAETCIDLAVQTRANPAGKMFFDQPAMNEVVILWNDPVSGLLCKARIDRLSKDFSWMLDLKSMENASADAFTRWIGEYSSGSQAAWYLTGIREATGVADSQFYFGALEKEPPRQAQFFHASQRLVMQGAAETERAFLKYAQGMKTGVWPSYSDEIQEADYPTWKQKRMENF